MNKKKLNQFLQYPEVLNLGAYMPPGTTDEDAIYDLQAVLMHRGPNASSGHYVARIKDLASGKWIELDDDVASDINVGNGAGLGDANEMGEQTSKASKSKRPATVPEGSHRCKNVYMLVYRSRNTLADATGTAGQPPVIPRGIMETINAANTAFTLERIEKIEENRLVVGQEQILSKAVTDHYSQLACTSTHRDDGGGSSTSASFGGGAVGGGTGGSKETGAGADGGKGKGKSKGKGKGTGTGKSKRKGKGKGKAKSPSPEKEDGDGDADADAEVTPLADGSAAAAADADFAPCDAAGDAVAVLVAVPVEDTEWIPTSWLEQWLEEAGSRTIDAPQRLETKDLVCQHNMMDPHKVTSAKRVCTAGLAALIEHFKPKAAPAAAAQPDTAAHVSPMKVDGRGGPAVEAELRPLLHPPAAAAAAAAISSGCASGSTTPPSPPPSPRRTSSPTFSPLRNSSPLPSPGRKAANVVPAAPPTPEAILPPAQRICGDNICRECVKIQFAKEDRLHRLEIAQLKVAAIMKPYRYGTLPYRHLGNPRILIGCRGPQP